MIIDQKMIDELISCQKKILKKPTPWKLDKGHYRTDFELQSVDENYLFGAFGRYNEVFNENFSFGLVYYPKHEKGNYELIRCNGPHGEHKQFPHHVHYHIHKATAENIESGLKEDSTIEITEKYTTFDEAFRFFVRYVNLNENDVHDIFPGEQTSMFNDL